LITTRAVHNLPAGMAFNVAFDQLKDQCDYIAFFDIDSFPAFYLSK
jgi:hypothetical protein